MSKLQEENNHTIKEIIPSEDAISHIETEYTSLVYYLDEGDKWVVP